MNSLSRKPRERIHDDGRESVRVQTPRNTTAHLTKGGTTVVD